jgi:hypothetical protein
LQVTRCSGRRRDAGSHTSDDGQSPAVPSYALLGWLEREQRDVIALLREDNRALKARLAGRRLRLNDAPR